MANLSFTLEEVISILNKNIKLPEQIQNIKADKNSIKVSIKYKPLLPVVDISIIFRHYSDKKIYFDIIGSTILEILSKIKLLNFKFEGEFYYLDNKEIVVDINKLLSGKVKGISVSDIVFSNDRFIIST